MFLPSLACVDLVRRPPLMLSDWDRFLESLPLIQMRYVHNFEQEKIGEIRKYRLFEGTVRLHIGCSYLECKSQLTGEHSVWSAEFRRIALYVRGLPRCIIGSHPMERYLNGKCEVTLQNEVLYNQRWYRRRTIQASIACNNETPTHRLAFTPRTDLKTHLSWLGTDQGAVSLYPYTESEAIPEVTGRDAIAASIYGG